MKKKSKLECVLEKAKEIFDEKEGKQNIRRCVLIAVEEEIGNAKMSALCNMLGIVKSDYIEYLIEEYKKVYKSQ